MKKYKFVELAMRYKRFILKLAKFAIAAKTNKEVDTGPDGIFEGDVGDLIVKKNNEIYVSSNADIRFTLLSDQFPTLTQRTEFVLSQGINKKASWIKTPNGKMSWRLLGYFSPMADTNCCMTGSV